MKLKYVDLFAGCGGLSLGLENQGFELALAVEKSDLAARTFCYNFIDKKAEDNNWWNTYLSSNIENQFNNKLIISPVSDVTSNMNLIKKLHDSKIDLVAGGPPCQGFSMAGKRQKTDPRNKLVWDFLNFVNGVQPKFVVIENVLGINRSFKKGEPTSFEELRKELNTLGYISQGFEVNAKNYGVPQNRPRMIIFGVRNDIVSSLNIKDFFIKNIIKDSDEITNPIRPILINTNPLVKDAFIDLDNNGYNSNQSSYSLFIKNNNTNLKNHIIRNHSEQVKSKFRLLGWLYENNIHSKILREINSDNIDSSLNVLLTNKQFPLALKNGFIIAQDKNEIKELLLKSATKKQSQRILDLNKVAPTVMSASDDSIHPTLYRGLTVREMARLQSFPDTFVFLGKETTGGKLRKFEVPQYTQVGNAVPPLLGEAIAKMIILNFKP